jgi:hypothetical protein
MSNDGSTGPGQDPYGQQGQPPQYGQQPPAYGQQPVDPHNPYAAPYAPGPPPPRPGSIDLAVTLMRVGAALSLLGLVLVFFMGDVMRETVEKSIRDSGAEVTPDAVDAAVAVGTGFAVVVGLIGVALWLWMAHMNGKGRGWARILATVFFGFFVLSTLVSLAQPAPGLSRVATFVQLALGAVIVVLLWKKESSAYYQAMSQRR